MTKIINRKTALSRKKNNKGFSLIELIIVITIMAILTSLLAPQLLRYVEQSRTAKDLTSIDEVYRAIQISLADETVFKSVASDDVYTLKDNGTALVLTAPADRETLLDDLQKTLGGTTGTTTLTLPLGFVSNTYKASTAKVEFTLTIVDTSVTVEREIIT